MTITTSNPLNFFVPVVTGFGVGTFGSKIFSDTTQPYRGGEVLTAYVESVKVTESSLRVNLGSINGVARKEAYASDLFERRTPVAGLGVGLPTDVMLFARVDRSWPGSAVMVDVSGRSRHAVSDADFAVVGGGRISFNGGAFDSLSTPHDADHAVEQPRIEAKVRLSFDDDLVLVDKDSYRLEVDGDTLVYTYTHSGGTVAVTSESLRQHGFRPRQDLIVGVEHLVQTGDTRFRFLTSTDGKTFNVLGQDQFAGAERTVVLSTDPLTVGPGIGEVFWVQVKDAENGALVATADLGTVPAGAVAWGSATGESWLLSHASMAAEPEVVDVGAPADWGLNLKGDAVRIPSAIEFEVATGGTIIVSIDTTQHPASDTVLFAHDEQPNQFSIVHTATGKLRVRLGESLYETPAVLGETAVTVAFDGTGVDVLANEVPFDALAVQPLPSKVLVAPSRSGTGSADDADYLFTGITMLRHRASASERQALAGALVA